MSRIAALALSYRNTKTGSLQRANLVLFGLITASLFSSILGFASIYQTVFLIFIAFMQNGAAMLSGRSSVRNNNYYHAIASVLSSFVFFATSRFLITREMPLSLLVPYTAGTVGGKFYGATVSKEIEKILGATTDNKENAKKNTATMLLLLGMLLGSELYILRSSRDLQVLFTLAVATMANGFVFASLRLLRSKDNYWLHLIAVILASATDFQILKIIVENKADWMLFIPQTTGGVIGSIGGAFISGRLANKLKASSDKHVTEQKKVLLPIPQILTISTLILPYLYFYGFNQIYLAGIMLLMILARETSYTVVSRAGQRDSNTYIAWASLFSNSLWFLTLSFIQANTQNTNLAIPFIIGASFGSLMGHGAAMKIEQKIGAVMDIGQTKAKPKPTTA